MKTRYGRGFTLEEIKAAGLNANFARAIGIAVDPRRQDTSLEAKELNAKRLKAYLSKLILFPSKRSKKLLKKGEPMTDAKKAPRKQIVADATAEKLKSAAANKQPKGKLVLPVQPAKPREKSQSITAEMKATKNFVKLRCEKVKQHYAGVRAKRAEQAQREAEEKAGK